VKRHYQRNQWDRARNDTCNAAFHPLADICRAVDFPIPCHASRLKA
jgi:hypothetical protein